MKDKETLLLLPGLICDAAAWAPQVQFFSSERQVIVANYGAADSLSLMATAALEQAPEHFALAGHSMGARVALEIMRLAPERVTRLALLDTGIHTEREGEREKRLALLALGQKKGMAKLVDLWLPPMVHPDRIGDSELMDPLRKMAIAQGPEGYERQIKALLSRPDVSGVLKDITCPMFVGVGAQDTWSPPAQHEQIVAAVIHANYEVFPDTGHMAPVESPDLVNRALANWLT